MNINVKQGNVTQIACDALIVNLFDGVRTPSGATGAVNQALDGLISEVIAGGDLRGKLGETVTLYPRGAIPARRVIVVGLGKAAEFGLEEVREASGAAIKAARKLGASTVATIVHGGGIGGLEPTEAAQALAEGSLLALYRYNELRSKKDKADEQTIDQLTVVEFDESKLPALEQGVRLGETIAQGVTLARTLVNQPSNIATPGALAQAAQTMCQTVGLSCRIMEEAELRELGMGALLAVTQGATEPAKFIIMEHKPAEATADGPVVLVGKGVTFDTGGYGIKSAGGMLSMKGDMGGAAAVIGAMQVVGSLKLPLHVVGLVPTVENMISGTAYKPSDVFTAKNGLSIEITSTDAEGRLILADALCYADTLTPGVVIDVATLTGGKVVALGPRTTALFANDQAEAWREALLAAAKKVGEPLWQLPLEPAYDRQLKSNVADLKNSGGRAASSITAARFLSHFTGDWPWLHLDIAGGELSEGKSEETPRSYVPKGATGIPLRTLVEALRAWKN